MSPSTAQLMSPSGTQHSVPVLSLPLQEVERNLQDAMQVCRNVLVDPQLVPGGGAAEMAVSHALTEKSKGMTGVEQWPYRAVAQALEVIPRTLIQNCGASTIRVLTSLRVRPGSCGAAPPSPGLLWTSSLSRGSFSLLLWSPSCCPPSSHGGRSFLPPAPVGYLLPLSSPRAPRGQLLSPPRLLWGRSFLPVAPVGQFLGLRLQLFSSCSILLRGRSTVGVERDLWRPPPPFKGGSP